MNCLRLALKRFDLLSLEAVLHRVPAVYSVGTPAACCFDCTDTRSRTEWSVPRRFSTANVMQAARAKNSKKKLAPKPIQVRPKKKRNSVVTIWKNMTVAELATSMGKDVDHVYEVMMYIESTNKYDHDSAAIDNMSVLQEICEKSGFRYITGSAPGKVEVKECRDVFRRPKEDLVNMVKRPPVVTIMGHVDHGKTTLLDSLRKSNIVEQEFGGITQHIGAFSVSLPSGERITFLDTPGHAAFSAMRARGAQATDIVVLVIAGEDGLMSQTIESIQHAQEAQVPIIVAINKIDKPEADVERTKRGLMSQGFVLEQDGGDIQVVPISALKGTNLLQLQEAIVTLAELMELKADPDSAVEGVVIESKTDPGRGKLATVLVQNGTLRRGANLIAGVAWAKVRGMFDEHGKPVQSAGPSTPVEVIGWRELPSAGDEVLHVESESRLKEALAWRIQQQKQEKMDKDAVIIQQKAELYQETYQQKLQERLSSGRKRYRKTMKEKESQDMKEGPELCVVIKGDVDGSVEAILDTLDTYQSPQCRLNILHYGVGPVTEGDIERAAVFNGQVLAFNVKTEEKLKKLAAFKGVAVKTHNVIYRLFDDLIDSITALLPSLTVEEEIGRAKVLEIFQITDERKKKREIAGCRCTRGHLHKQQYYKVHRDAEIVFQGRVNTLKHFKNDVDTIKMDMECGLRVDDDSFEFQRGDEIVCYKLVETEQKLDWRPGF